MLKKLRSFYSGKWYVEVKTKNIIAAGVYYAKIDEGFENDELMYWNLSGPDPDYAKNNEI